MNKTEKINELAKFFKTVTVFEDDKVTEYEKKDGGKVVAKEVEVKNIDDFQNFINNVFDSFKS